MTTTTDEELRLRSRGGDAEHTFVDHQDEVAALATAWVRQWVPTT